MTKQEYYEQHRYKANCPYCGREFTLELFKEELVRGCSLVCRSCGNAIHIDKDKSCKTFEDFVRDRLGRRIEEHIAE